MENTMTDHRLPYSTVSASLCAAIAAAFLASAPISSAAAAGSAGSEGASTGNLQDLQAQCGTVLAQPGFASGADAAACQGYVASHMRGMNGESNHGPNPNDMRGPAQD
jgi:hypothetical protein